jgi:hypothetical protein
VPGGVVSHACMHACMHDSVKLHGGAWRGLRVATNLVR